MGLVPDSVKVCSGLTCFVWVRSVSSIVPRGACVGVRHGLRQMLWFCLFLCVSVEEPCRACAGLSQGLQRFNRFRVSLVCFGGCTVWDLCRCTPWFSRFCLSLPCLDEGAEWGLCRVTPRFVTES